MATLDELLETLTQHEKRQNHDAMRTVREQIAHEFPDSDAAAEALYKIGLDTLFRRRELVAAMELFTTATKRKHPFWSQAARTSLGLCYHHQGNTQKALFELRRVGYTNDPNMHSVTALAFIENIFTVAGNAEEVTRARRERITQLTGLVEKARAAKAKQDLGFYLYQLGLTQLDAKHMDEGRAHLAEAKMLGPSVLGAELYRSVVNALA